MLTTPQNSGASPFACTMANRIMALDGFDTVREPMLLAEVARIIDASLKLEQENRKELILGTFKPDELVEKFQKMGIPALSENHTVKVWTHRSLEELQAIRNEIEGR